MIWLHPGVGEMTEQYEITLDKQHYSVVKSNELIQKTTYSLSAQAQKIILYLVSRIKPGDTEFEDCTFDVAEFCKIAGIDYKDSRSRSYVRAALDKLLDQKFQINTDDYEKKGVWIYETTLNKKAETITVRFTETLKPFLLQLSENFTAYELANVLSMKSKYAIRLYELLKSHSNQKVVSYDVARLRGLMLIDKYPQYKEFKRNVIDKAVSEINLYTDLDVSYEPQKTGRSVTSLLFNMKKKETKDNVTALLARHDRLNKRKVD